MQKVFINWNKREVISEAALGCKIADLSSEYGDDDNLFNGWLNENYTAVSLYKTMNDGGKDTILAGFHDYCDRLAETKLRTEWSETEVDGDTPAAAEDKQ